MKHTIVEIKARSTNHKTIRKILKEQNAVYKGVDNQIDTYFNFSFGRLKLREGNIENCLVYYDREDKQGPKQSNVILYETASKSSLKEILSKSLGILVVVNKLRDIYFINNVKFHLDVVKDLGSFVEIEAIDKTGAVGHDRLLEQCTHYMGLFKIKQEDLISCSYSDLLLQK